ncbi:DnaD domain-containing protein [Aerococcaceae bacterium WGS1372]
MQSSIYDWMKNGFTAIPNVLFDQFHSLELSGDEMVLLLFMMSLINRNIPVKDIEQVANGLGWSNHEVFEGLNALLNKDFLDIELVTNQEGKKEDHYTLRPLFDKLDEIHFQKTSQTVNEPASNESLNVVPLFEQEFGRQLTQIELETLGDWVNVSKYDGELIKLALKQAVLNQALSLKYIDRILLNWEKKILEQ